MSEFTLNFQPMWNPADGRNVERILRTQGVYLYSDSNKNFFGDKELEYAESNAIYMEMIQDSANLKTHLKCYGLKIKLEDGGTEGYYNPIPNAVVCAYISEGNYGSKYINILCNNTQGDGVYWVFDKEQYDIVTNTWNIIDSSLNQNIATVGFEFLDESDSKPITMNINMPYIPVFETQVLAEAYINNPFNSYNYKQALNYYDPKDYSQPVDKEKYKYDALSSLVKQYAEVAKSKDAYSTNLYIDNVLAPINTLLASYKKISYENKIRDLKNKIAQNLVNINDYKSMELIEAPTSTVGQATWPQQAPFIPVRTFSPFSLEELDHLISWCNSYCSGHSYRPSSNYPYFLMIDNSAIYNNKRYYNIRLVQAFSTDFDKNGHFRITNNSNKLQEDDYYFINFDVTTKLTYAKGETSFANHISFKYYPKTSEFTDIVNEGNTSENITHGSTLILDYLNTRVPFYCSHDIYVLDRHSHTYKWLAKTDADTVSTNSVVAADVVPAGMIHIKPILLLFNRYEMSYVNGWDGNKVKVADGYIMAPRMGAGQKEDDNSFTGVIMGVKQQNVDSKENQRIGLFGFNHGEQSMFLNSRDGSAIFGLSGSGQITIDPSTKKGLLYSGNYWKDYNSSDGKPKNYSKSNENGAGMLIDLTTPEIKFGSGKFLVTSEGEMTAQGGGHIARWDITDYTIESNVTANQGKLVLHSGIYEDDNGNTQYGYGYIYSGHHSYFGSYSKGFYLSHAGLSVCNGNRSRLELSTDGDPVIYSGSHSTIDSSAQGFYLGQDGLSISGRYYDNATDPNHEHPITSRIAIRTDSNPVIYSGGHSTLNSSSKGFYLSQDGLSISNGSTSRLTFATNGDPVIYSGGHNTLASTSNGFYLGNDGLSIGNGFKINATGVFYLGYNATTFDCSNLDQPKTFRIGGAANSIYMGVEGFRLGNKTAVDNNGNLVTEHLIIKNTASDYDTMCWIGNWQFTNENFGAVYKVSNSQWNRLWMSAHGLIQAEQWNREPAPGGVPGTDYNIVWALNTDGTATFTNLDATIPSGKSLSVGGSLIVSGTATISGSLTAGGVTLSNSGINADEGTIGGFTISTSGIGSSTGGNAYMSSNNMGAANGWFSNLYVNNSKFVSTSTQVVTDVWTDATGVHCDYTTIQYLGLASS